MEAGIAGKDMMQRNYRYINLELIYEMADGDDAFVAEIINDYFTSLEEGKKQMRQSIEDADKEQMVFHAHKLKGLLRFIGAEEAGAVFYELEQQGKENINVEYANQLMEKVSTQLQLIDIELKDVLTKIEGGS